MRLQLRTGDRAIIVGVAAIAAYEIVVDDDDLITYRIAAYRRHWLGRLLVDTAILVTALHLTDGLPETHDPYHWAMQKVRRNVGGQE